MRDITKGPEPEALQRHRRDVAVGPTFDNLPRGEVKAALSRDQRGLCCYCMRRLDLATARIEHWAPKSKHPDRALDWQNLLLACDGHAGEGPEAHTCDVLTSDTEIALDPLNGVERWLRYDAQGRILARRADHTRDIEQTLGLNRPQLTRGRRAAVDGLIDGLRRKKADKEWSREWLESEQRRLGERERLQAFHALLDYWIGKLAARR
ncbi:MAG: TIGR02646 family protein [Myxococcales bacterium]|nr:TIGR02646 family protein [Myxococcales bacterium]MCB9537200.1 TIGR02646 family protein [Myxococcales bacterium]